MNPNQTIRTCICPCKIEQLQINEQPEMFFEFAQYQWLMKGNDWRTFIIRIAHDLMSDIDNESNK